MSYFISRAELQAILCIERSMSYVLQTKGVLPEPTKGFGKNKLFDLHATLEAAHSALGWPKPNEEIIHSHWQAILANRLQNR